MYTAQEAFDKSMRQVNKIFQIYDKQIEDLQKRCDALEGKKKPVKPVKPKPDEGNGGLSLGG